MEPETAVPDGWREPSAASFPAAAVSTAKRINIGVPADDSGHPDWERATDKVKARFRELINDERTREQFLAATGAESAIDPQAALMLGKMAVGAFFQMQMVVAVIRYKPSKEELADLQACFSPKFDTLPGVDFDKALTRVIQKRGPEWLAAFADEITVGGLLVMASLGCWNRAGEVAARNKGNSEAKVEVKKVGLEVVSPAAPVYQT